MCDHCQYQTNNALHHYQKNFSSHFIITVLGSLDVSELSFYSGDPSLNPVVVYLRKNDFKIRKWEAWLMLTSWIEINQGQRLQKCSPDYRSQRTTRSWRKETKGPARCRRWWRPSVHGFPTSRPQSSFDRRSISGVPWWARWTGAQSKSFLVISCLIKVL